MNKGIKVKKTIGKELQEKILSWFYEIYDEKWEKVESINTIWKYKYKLSNTKKFMKKWIDRKIHNEITKWLRDVDLWFIYKFEPYIDEDNIINFKKFKVDYNYTDSKLSKAKKPLLDAWIIREYNGFIYLNPIIGIIGQNISPELIEIFDDTFSKYKVKVTF